MDNSRFKFRVWDNVKKEMIYPECCEMHEDKVITLGGQLCHVNCELYEYKGEIMQSTGLYDCEGREIFEGDYVQYSKEKPNKCPIFEVKFINGAFVGSLETNCGGIRNRDICHLKELCCDEYYVDGKANFKVIGNRFTNPELLEAQK